ncbi:(2Fe-2S) ferredoxin domain-containing protein [Thermosynechococcaceae cyanobacterium Okahandja]
MNLAVDFLPQYCLEGVVQEVLYKNHQPKRLALETSTGVQWVKLKKSLRRQLSQAPKVGDRLRLYGKPCFKGGYNLSDYKAEHLEFLAVAPAPAPLCKVLICQKSSCCRRGAKQLWQELEQQAMTQQLPVTLKATGCLGECKRGPAVVVLPQKKRVTHANARQIEAVVRSSL